MLLLLRLAGFVVLEILLWANWLNQRLSSHRIHGARNLEPRWIDPMVKHHRNMIFMIEHHREMIFMIEHHREIIFMHNHSSLAV